MDTLPLMPGVPNYIGQAKVIFETHFHTEHARTAQNKRMFRRNGTERGNYLKLSGVMGEEVNMWYRQTLAREIKLI